MDLNVKNHLSHLRSIRKRQQTNMSWGNQCHFSSSVSTNDVCILQHEGLANNISQHFIQKLATCDGRPTHFDCVRQI